MDKKDIYSNVSDDYLNKILASKGFTRAKYDRMPSSFKNTLEANLTAMELEEKAKQTSASLPSEIAKIQSQSVQARLGDDIETKKRVMVASVIAGSILVIGIITALIIRKKRLK